MSKATGTCARCGGSHTGNNDYYCIECMRWYRRMSRLGQLPRPEARACSACQRQYIPGCARTSIFCSRACKDGYRNARDAAQREAAKPERRCIQCGAAMPRAMRLDAKFCSADCNSKAHALQRKLRARTNNNTDKPGYLRVYIADRDGWRCGICRRRVDRQRTYPDPACASLDHVIPVSEGGTSDPANLRLTHLRCNLVRNNRGGNEQLALVG